MAFLSSGKAEAVTNGLGIATTLLSLYSKLELQLWQMPRHLLRHRSRCQTLTLLMPVMEGEDRVVSCATQRQIV